jgi:hypothetical protein
MSLKEAVLVRGEGLTFNMRDLWINTMACTIRVQKVHNLPPRSSRVFPARLLLCLREEKPHFDSWFAMCHLSSHQNANATRLISGYWAYTVMTEMFSVHQGLLAMEHKLTAHH